MLLPSSASSFFSFYPCLPCQRSHPQIPHPLTVPGFHLHFAHGGHILILGFRQMFFCFASTDGPWASIACAPYNNIFLPCLNHLDHVECIQQEHACSPLLGHPDKSAYAEKSFIVHINCARITKLFFFEESNVRTPTFHSSCNSSIND